MDVFQDGQGQYILASNGQRIDGWWQLEDDADPAVLIGPDGTVVSGAGELLAARQHATKNRVEIEASALCGCFYCLSLFKPQAIKDWLDFDAGGPRQAVAFSQPGGENRRQGRVRLPLCRAVAGDRGRRRQAAGFLARRTGEDAQRGVHEGPLAGQ